MSAAKHIPHEHFIMALSALVIALSSVILTSHPVEAETNPESRTMRVYCSGPDQINIQVKNTTALIKTDFRNPSIKNTIIEKTSTCIGRRTVREYFCVKTNTGISSKIMICDKDLICDDGACVKPAPAPEASTNTVETPPAG